MKQLKMTLWMLLCILTMTACGGDDDDLGYKGVAVEYSDVVGKTIFTVTWTMIKPVNSHL